MVLQTATLDDFANRCYLASRPARARDYASQPTQMPNAACPGGSLDVNGLDLFPSVLAPCSLGCSGTARPEPAPAGTSRHDCPSRASSEEPSGALPMIGDLPPQLPQTGHRAGSSRVTSRLVVALSPAISARHARQDARPIRRARRSLLTSGGC